MKFTPILWRQNVGRMLKRHWFYHGQQVLGDTKSEISLAKRGIEVLDAKELILKKPHHFPRLNVEELFGDIVIPKSPEHNENHPDWKERPSVQLKSDDLLVAGADQAQLLSKTLLVSENLPIQIENSIEETTEEIDNILAEVIRSSNIFDAHQQKLPKRKHPEQPAWVFPRDYGIGQVRKSRNLITRMIQLCESLSGLELAQQRQLIHDGVIHCSLEKDGDFLLFDQSFDMMMMTNNGIKPMGNDIDTSKLSIPDIHPLNSTISLHRDHIYKTTEFYPVSKESPWVNVHTLFIYHDCEKVQNLTELPVTNEQRFGRSLTKSFVAAVGCAKKKFGSDVKDLPEPITVQCVQTNSQSFHFSVFQLNTLNVDGIDGKCNLWWSMPEIDLFSQADYELGRPVLTGYNPEVFKRVLAFYRNN